MVLAITPPVSWTEQEAYLIRLEEELIRCNGDRELLRVAWRAHKHARWPRLDSDHALQAQLLYQAAKMRITD